MKYTICIIVLIIGIATFWWGAELLYHNYALQLDVVYILKSGVENVSAEVTAQNSKDAAMELAAHLSLIVAGIVCVLIALLFMYRTHNKRYQSDTQKPACR